MYWRIPPPLAQNFLDFMKFSEILGTSNVGAHPPPPPPPLQGYCPFYENHGSALIGCHRGREHPLFWANSFHFHACFGQKKLKTSMHSSMMCTGRLLTICPPGFRQTPWYLRRPPPRRQIPPQKVDPPMNRQTPVKTLTCPIFRMWVVTNNCLVPIPCIWIRHRLQ